MLRRKFKWSNNQQIPSLARLDRILISLGTSLSLPLASVMGGEMRLSDHSALIFHAGQSTSHLARPFRLDNFWLAKDCFRSIILAAWSVNSLGGSATTMWIQRWRRLRKVISQWAVQFRKECKARRTKLEQDIEGLNHSAELRDLAFDELASLK
ncbi:hypothetical protein Cni_G28687 [Canna indica]|uniref:Reverse transcriptase n=1 Tax=Canna indica TaxID=4628 RepID=A0AAQ3L3U1_9LILI|nr:hypothetical protein Cni_G28687 [Canna indica]